MGKKPPSAAVLFPHLRQRVLATLLLHPKREWYLSELVRQLACAPAHLHRELALLVEAGILSRRTEGRQVYYAPDRNCPYLPELTALIRKTMGIPVVLATALKPLRQGIVCAFIYGSVARQQEQPGSDVDLMVVGDVTTTDLLPALTKAEKETGRPVNPTIYPVKELAENNRQGNHFIRALLADQSKVFLIGTIDDLEIAANGRAAKTSRDKQTRDRRTAGRRRR